MKNTFKILAVLTVLVFVSCVSKQQPEPEPQPEIITLSNQLEKIELPPLTPHNQTIIFTKTLDQTISQYKKLSDIGWIVSTPKNTISNADITITDQMPPNIKAPRIIIRQNDKILTERDHFISADELGILINKMTNEYPKVQSLTIASLPIKNEVSKFIENHPKSTILTIPDVIRQKINNRIVISTNQNQKITTTNNNGQIVVVPEPPLVITTGLPFINPKINRITIDNSQAIISLQRYPTLIARFID